CCVFCLYFFFQAEDGIRDRNVTGVQTCALPISGSTLNDTSCTDTSWSSILFCNAVILLDMGRQTVVQFVKTKSAIHQSPFRSSSDTDSSCSLEKEKSATSSDIFVSIGSMLHALSSNIMIKMNTMLILLIMYQSVLLMLEVFSVYRYYYLIRYYFCRQHCLEVSKKSFNYNCIKKGFVHTV